MLNNVPCLALFLAVWLHCSLIQSLWKDFSIVVFSLAYFVFHLLVCLIGVVSVQPSGVTDPSNPGQQRIKIAGSSWTMLLQCFQSHLSCYYSLRVNALKLHPEAKRLAVGEGII